MLSAVDVHSVAVFGVAECDNDQTNFTIGGIFKAVLFLLTSWCLSNKFPRHRPVIIAAALANVMTYLEGIL